MQVFDPAQYSLGELKFVRERLGMPPTVVLREAMPHGVSAGTITTLLREIYDLEELRTHRGEIWIGIEALQQAIDTYLREYERWQDMTRRGAPKFPTLYAWDARGRAHRYGVGSDGGQVRTWIDADGVRHKFAVDLRPVDHEEFVPSWLRPQEPLPDALVEDMDNGVVSCPICGYAQTFNPDSPSSQRMARARIGRHCKSKSVKDPDRHREFYTHVFGE